MYENAYKNYMMRKCHQGIDLAIEYVVSMNLHNM